jgi:phenylalanyl-tRNA synthetase beta subunit
MKKTSGKSRRYFREHPPKNLAHAAGTIAQLTGIVRSREQVRQFLKSMGMRCRRWGDTI